jgi:hypothetical protein
LYHESAERHGFLVSGNGVKADGADGEFPHEF